MKKIALILLSFMWKAVAAVLLAAVMILAATSISPVYNFERPEPFSGPDIFNPYAGVDSATVWKRANFHTHTRVDGLLNECPEYPDVVYDDYKRLGYDILTFSNHNELTRHPYDSTLQVNVYEHGYSIFKFHKLVFGCDRVKHFDHLLPLFVSQKQWQYDYLGRDADFIQMNHPDRTNHTTRRSMELLTGYRIMEVDSGVNTECTHWDEALSAGHYSFCLANDDCHDSGNHARIARRCNWLDCPSGRYEDIRETLLSGRYYAMRVPDFGDGDWDVKYAENARLPRVERIGLRGDTIFVKLSRPAELIKATGCGHAILDSLSNTDTFEYVMKAGDPYARLTAAFDNGVYIYSQPFARYDAKEATSPYRESPHPVNVPLTVLFNLAVLAILFLCGWCIRSLFSHKEHKA